MSFDRARPICACVQAVKLLHVPTVQLKVEQIRIARYPFGVLGSGNGRDTSYQPCVLAANEVRASLPMLQRPPEKYLPHVLPVLLGDLDRDWIVHPLRLGPDKWAEGDDSDTLGLTVPDELSLRVPGLNLNLVDGGKRRGQLLEHLDGATSSACPLRMPCSEPMIETHRFETPISLTHPSSFAFTMASQALALPCGPGLGW